MATNAGFVHVVLNENDVPGASLMYKDISSNSVLQLKRWLQCRGIKQSGNKTELIKRVQEAIQLGRDIDIDINVDDPKWYEQKLKTLTISNSTVNSHRPPVPPITGWKAFPSGNVIPHFFNKGHIYHYFFETALFSNKSLTLDAGTSKPLDRGKLYFSSGHIQELMDVSTQGFYFVKAKVMASYRINTFYPVHITLVADTGYICDSSCECVASSLGRCSHVAGTLFAILDFMKNTAPFADMSEISVTSKACTWNRGRQGKRLPGKIFDTVYSKKKKQIIQVVNFNPIKDTSGINMQKNVNALVTALKVNNVQNSMFASLLSYVHDDYGLSHERKDILIVLRQMLLESITVSKGSDDNFGRHPTALTETQGTEDWKRQRKLRITASEAKRFANCKTNVSIKNLLYNKLWNNSSIETAALKYGKDNEEFAKKEYLLYKQKTVQGFYIFNTGLWSRANISELAVSPDGIYVDPSVQSASDPTAKFGLVEVKCPYVLRDADPNNFEEHLSQSQKNAFCLKRDDNGTVHLKLTHCYYYQIQMQLGVMNLVYCDFVVWSKKGFFYQRIDLDIDFWEQLKSKLIHIHHTRLCPEYFEMRTVKNLAPFYLDI